MATHRESKAFIMPMSGVQSVLHVILEEARNHGLFMRSLIPCDVFRHLR